MNRLHWPTFISGSRSNDESASETVTGRDGMFRIVVPPGTYDISIRQNSLFGSIVRDVEIQEGEQSTADMRMRFAPGPRPSG
jgi:hypothetical protein